MPKLDAGPLTQLLYLVAHTVVPYSKSGPNYDAASVTRPQRTSKNDGGMPETATEINGLSIDSRRNEASLAQNRKLSRSKGQQQQHDLKFPRDGLDECGQSGRSGGFAQSKISVSAHTGMPPLERSQGITEAKEVNKYSDDQDPVFRKSLNRGNAVSGSELMPAAARPNAWTSRTTPELPLSPRRHPLDTLRKKGFGGGNGNKVGVNGGGDMRSEEGGDQPIVLKLRAMLRKEEEERARERERRKFSEKQARLAYASSETESKR